MSWWLNALTKVIRDRDEGTTVVSGAIYNTGSLNIQGTEFLGDSAQGGSGGSSVGGAGGFGASAIGEKGGGGPIGVTGGFGGAGGSGGAGGDA